MWSRRTIGGFLSLSSFCALHRGGITQEERQHREHIMVKYYLNNKL